MRTLRAEIEQLRLAEQGAQDAYAVLVQSNVELRAECRRLQALLGGAHDLIRKLTRKGA